MDVAVTYRRLVGFSDDGDRASVALGMPMLMGRPVIVMVVPVIMRVGVVMAVAVIVFMVMCVTVAVA